jgi:TP901 family phage tail tape measure protein
MADEIKLKAPTVEQQVVVNINGEDKLKSFADTLDKISNNKNLQKYWKTQQDLINATADAYGNFQKKASKDNASELIKVTNALKAMSGTDLSHILPDFDKISKSMAEAQKVAGDIDSAFSVKGFKEAFDSFETLKAYGTDIQKLFSHFGVSSDIGELQQNVRLLEGEVEKLTRRLNNARNANEELRNEFENFKVGSGFADKLDELDRLKLDMQNIRNEAIQTFNQFLDANKIDRYDWFSDDRFAEYFEKLENGTLTATDAIRRFKSEYSYLLEDSYKSNGDSFGLDQLQAFSTKLDSIFHQVEETSNKINDIISNGVIAKSVQNLSEDTTLSDSQRSIFGNILQDEESLKSITALFQKLIDETNQPKNTEIFNTEQFTKIESLFTSIESSLSSIKGVLVDVGDGEELSPLLKQLDNIREVTSNIKLSLNLDLGNEVSERLNQKVSQATQRQLEAYRKLFSAMKGTGKTNKEMLKFFEPDEASATELIGAYQGIIKRAEEKFKVGNSNVYKKLLGSTYDDLKKEIKNANAQLGRAENKRSENGILGDLFGNSKDLSGVIEQLNTIVSKLDEISVSAKGFTEIFKNGLNVNASVEEIEKLTNRVKELEAELAKIKTPTTIIPSEDMKDAFPNTDTKLDEAVTSAKDLDKTLKQVDIPTDSFDKVLEKLDRTKSELVDIVKITKQSVSDKDGKFHDSYTLKDSRGSTEIYGINSKTDKGQILRQNIVSYDVKKDTSNNSKAQAHSAKEEWTNALKTVKEYETAVSKLNNLKASDKGLGIKSNEIAEQEKKIDDMKSSFDAAQTTIISFLTSIDKFNTLPVSSIQEVSNVIKLIQTASEGSAESVAKLEDALRNVEKVNLDNFEKEKNQKINKLSSYTDGTKYTSEFKSRVSDEIAKIQKLQFSNPNDVTILKQIDSEIQEIINDSKLLENKLVKQESHLADIISQMKIYRSENTNMSSSQKSSLNSMISSAEELAHSGKVTAEQIEQIKIAFSGLKAEISETGRTGKNFFSQIGNRLTDMNSKFVAQFLSWQDWIMYIRQAAEMVIELNTKITELAKVSEDSVSQIYADFDSYANIAKEMGSTISDTIAATTAWSKNGYNIPDSKELAEVSLLYKNVGDGINIDEANESLVSTLKGFKLEADQAEHIVDVFNKVSNNEPISSSGIGDALQRSAASFNAANTSLEKSVALVTATNSVLQDPEKVGNMWKTVSARIRGAKTELEEAGEDTDGMVESTSKLQALIKGMTGFDIMKSDGKTFKDIYDIIVGIGEKWQDLNDIDRASLLESLAGKNQSNALAAALSQVDLLKKAYGEATNAEGSAREENSKYQQSVQYSIDQTKAKLEELANDTLNSNFLKGAIDAGGKLIEVLDGIVKSGNAIPTLLAAIGAGLSLKNIGKCYVSA